jgi:hypothetical protein
MIHLYHQTYFFLISFAPNKKDIMTTNPHIISLSEAATMTHAYQNAPQFQGLTIACMMDNMSYQQVISQPECVSLRTYFALDEQNNLTIVVVGVDQFGNDMTNGIILERSTRCLIHCSNNSPLM